MPTPPIVHQLQDLLNDKRVLYPAIIELDSQAVSDLYAAIDKVADLCRTTIYVRTHWMNRCNQAEATRALAETIREGM